MTDAPKPVLPLSLDDSIRDEFNALFYEPVSVALQKKTNLHLHVLRVVNGDFNLAGLYDALQNNSVPYVLSRQKYQRAKKNPAHMGTIVAKVQRQFRAPDPKAGEGGEVILYSLLEGHLGAPKVLSKMELKTDPEHYVYGSDGVHLLQTGERSFQLIFGESKMYGDAGKPGQSAKRGIRAAFKSIADVVQEGFEFDSWLVESELLKEELDEEALSVLSAILLPATKGGDDAITKHNAFGIFVGYEVDFSDMSPSEMELDEIEVELRRRATDAIEGEHELIKQEINDRNLGGYPIHLYAVPFVKRGSGDNDPGIEKVRMDLAALLSNKPSKKKETK